MNTAIIPQTYQEWHHCITVICQQPLTLSYVEERITALNSSKDYMTKKFVQLYGESQRQKTMQWFEQAKNTLK
ncbi:hypothetical protein C9J44_02225 [Photobacterium sp. GB-27]|uniref:hypothetical protein n=1 Tax=Photobacterium sp. GB-27 TaxID=2022109 RepID=UPI000D17BA06|nr:hypothetical protein [Photobacterium sp. GB-27]PSV38646.1 hypothetical protein C9J44_02225 [Photobacterium sp. GB-27]